MRRCTSTSSWWYVAPAASALPILWYGGTEIVTDTRRLVRHDGCTRWQVVGRDGTQTLTNEAGEVTAHLQGMMTRTTRMLEAGIKPVFVFDGKAPEAKGRELAKRRERSRALFGRPVLSRKG